MSSNDSIENSCVVCFKSVCIYSVGECDHAVCYECSTRMRVLCRQNECPICRKELPKVVFTKEIRPFRNYRCLGFFMDKKYKICFEDRDVQKAYNKLLEHNCKICSMKPAFRTFQNLKDHMRKEHELFYCDLCVDNLNIFSSERKCYTRQDLALHRRRGDADDRSHKGHPLCEFCDQRYMDNDELFRHLRRDHLFCHFCDADGFHQYYSSYDFLRDHFRTEHYLCEEGNCIEEKFTSVFRTEIDLKAHRASIHGKTIGKAAAKQARTLELEFTLAPRARERTENRRGPGRPRIRPDEEHGVAAVSDGQFENACTSRPRTCNINTDCIDEFPTLGGAAANTNVSNTDRGKSADSGLTIRTMRQIGAPLTINDVNFPALGPDYNVSNCNTLRFSVNTANHDRTNNHIANIVKTGKPTNVSIHVNRRPASSVYVGSKSTVNNVTSKDGSNKACFDREFPTLGSSASTSLAHSSSTQTQSNGAKARVLPRPQQTKSFRSEEEFPSLNTKFTTDCNIGPSSSSAVQSKKATSLVIPVSDSSSKSYSSDNCGKPPGNAGSGSSFHNGETVVALENSSLSNIKVKSRKKKTKNANSSSSDFKKTQEQNCPIKEEQKDTISNNINFVDSKSNSEIKKYETDGINKNFEANLNNQYLNSGVERKRSELLIGNLYGDESSRTFTDKFLSSCSNNNVANSVPVPPGFSKLSAAVSTSLSNPPPGFDLSIKGPPPGFSKTKLVKMPLSNGLTFTNSSGESYPISPDGSVLNTNYRFVLPPNFDCRNERLASQIQLVIQNLNSLQEFKDWSKLYRQNQVSAREFYKQCKLMMGEPKFLEIFPELLVLLPDIQKQQELWQVHTNSSNAPKKMLKRLELEQCVSCKQIVAKTDLSHHIASHALETAYPVLGTSDSSTHIWTKN